MCVGACEQESRKTLQVQVWVLWRDGAYRPRQEVWKEAPRGTVGAEAEVDLDKACWDVSLTQELKAGVCYK